MVQTDSLFFPKHLYSLALTSSTNKIKKKEAAVIITANHKSVVNFGDLRAIHLTSSAVALSYRSNSFQLVYLEANKSSKKLAF